MKPWAKQWGTAAALLALAGVLSAAGCGRTQPTPEQAAGPNAPPGLGAGPSPAGGPSAAITGGGAGGSAAGGYESGRIGGPPEAPVTPPYPGGSGMTSRMSPVASDGSGGGDRGRPLPPDAPLPGTPAASPGTPSR